MPRDLPSLQSATERTVRLREYLMTEVAQAIKERQMTQRKAAEHLGVSQPRISQLVRRKSQHFTVDALVHMLFALECPVELSVSGRQVGDLGTADLRDGQAP